jgi:hypothetical protein
MVVQTLENQANDINQTTLKVFLSLKDQLLRLFMENRASSGVIVITTKSVKTPKKDLKLL